MSSRCVISGQKHHVVLEYLTHHVRSTKARSRPQLAWESLIPICSRAARMRYAPSSGFSAANFLTSFISWIVALRTG
jgi:hypothetical protein